MKLELPFYPGVELQLDANLIRIIYHDRAAAPPAAAPAPAEDCSTPPPRRNDASLRPAGQ